MKVLVLAPDFPPREGGIANFVEHICTELERNDFELSVLAPAGAGDVDADGGFEFPVHRYRLTKCLSSALPTAKTLWYGLRHHASLIFLGSFASTHALGALLMYRLFGVPYVILIHGFDLSVALNSSRVDGLVSGMVLENARFVLANSAYTKTIVRQAGYDEGGRIAVVNPGVDIERFRPGLDPSAVVDRYHLAGKKVILSVSRLIPRKGHTKVLEALPLVLRKVPNLIYLIVGRGQEEARLRGLAGRLGLESWVIFAGYVQGEELPLFYSASDVFILPSEEREEGDFEGFGMVYLEAGACGKPVIGGKAGGVPEAVVDGATGLLVDPMDTVEIANALTRLLTDEDYARKLGANGRRRVEELSWPQVGRRVATHLAAVARS